MKAIDIFLARVLAARQPEAQQEPRTDALAYDNGRLIPYYCAACRQSVETERCPVCGSDTLRMRHHSQGVAPYAVLSETVITAATGKEYRQYTMKRVYGKQGEIVTDYELLPERVYSFVFDTGEYCDQ